MKLSKYQKQAFVSAVMDDLPDRDHAELKAQAQAALVDAMSPECRALYEKNPKAVRDSCINSLGARYGYSTDYLIIGDADTKEILKPFQERAKVRREFRTKLENTVSGLNSLKQLQETFPELTKYMPAEASKTPNLPAVSGIMEALEALGWKGVRV
jgi:hypothetical protein